MQINTTLVQENTKMNAKYMSIMAVAALAAMLVASTALTSTDDAFADKKKKKKGYEKSQALSQANACGNGELPLNVFCSNTASQIQGDENAVGITSTQSAEETIPVMG